MGLFYWIGYTGSKIFARTVCSMRVQNRKGLKGHEGGLIVASNHVSFLDPPLIGSSFSEPIHYFARKSLFDHPVARFILTRVNALPVNQARPELSVLKEVIRLLRSEEKVLIFPEGERSWGGGLKMEGQPGVGMIVSKARVPVLPVRIFGPEKALPRGAGKVKRHPVTLVVGEPIDFSDILDDPEQGAKEKYKLIAERIMEAIAALELQDSRGE